MTGDRSRRAALHAALGEPVRLAIVEELAASDRSPGALGRRLGIRGNLLAHHLDTLERVGLIRRVESQGDRRRRYVRLNRAELAELAPAPPPTPRHMLFICTHNSARSQLAAALWRERTGRTPSAAGTVSSAGTHPADRIHRGTLAAAQRAGLDLGDARPRLLGRAKRTDQVVTVCDRANEELEPGPSWWHWSIPDPVEDGSDAAFDAAIAELDDHIRSLVPPTADHEARTR
jgi:ArsR family transcriptional regulator, arsenate/arsenite/antimonite-responsive transcriptional repressor / arsenate reductase (thioredoxin)